MLVLYRPRSDHRRQVDEFIHNIQANGFSGKVEVVDIDTRDGSSTATLYDVNRYPAVLILRDDGALQQIWEGLELPMVNEVEAYFGV